ncbi:MAG: enoyl-CoA hydratase/isomerase family protein, partial [Myxococcota bacterium]
MTDATASPSNAEPALLEETSGGVRILTLNRPAKKNALSSDLVQAIVEGFAAAAADADVRVIGLTGAGDAFCSGADLTEPRPAAGEFSGRAKMADAAVRMVSGIRVDCEKPVIAGVGG